MNVMKSESKAKKILDGVRRVLEDLSSFRLHSFGSAKSLYCRGAGESFAMFLLYLKLSAKALSFA